MMKRRAFVAAGLLVLVLLASGAFAQSSKPYVCPPCGCSHDGIEHDAPGACPVCGMALVDKTSINEVTAIPNFLKLNSQVWTGGQPTLDQLAKLKQEGVKAVINLRPPSESNDEGVQEAARLKELGVPYFNIPVVYTQPLPQDADMFLKITDEQLKNGPVFIHCAAGIRVGAFWMIRRVLRDGWDFDRALEEAHTIGLGSQQHLIEFAKDYIEKNKKK
jgi:uncharacterized protein (TIGR01244 family)